MSETHTNGSDTNTAGNANFSVSQGVMENQHSEKTRRKWQIHFSLAKQTLRKDKQTNSLQII